MIQLALFIGFHVSAEVYKLGFASIQEAMILRRRRQGHMILQLLSTGVQPHALSSTSP